MYLSDNENAEFTSGNPQYNDAKDETMEFYLSNGQLDEYPLSWVLPKKQIEKALDYFQKIHKPPLFITWHNDET